MQTSVGEFEKWLAFLPWEPWLIPIQPHGKLPDVPQGESWKNPRFRLTRQQAHTRLAEGKNVAIVATGNDYVLLDEDDPSRFRFAVDTLTVRTRNGNYHKYTINGGDVKNADGKGQYAGCGEVRAEWKYVLTPGSYVPPDQDCAEGATGLYAVIVAKALVTLHAADLPPEFQPTPIQPRPESPTPPPTFAARKFPNRHGWSLDEIRAYDPKLNALLQGADALQGYPSASEADMATLAKLLYWEYSEAEATSILKTFRARDKLERDDYLQMTLDKITPSPSVSTFHDPTQWRPNPPPKKEVDPTQIVAKEAIAIVLDATKKVEKIIPTNPNDPRIYKIYVQRDGITNVIELTATKIMNSGTFRWKWLGIYDEVLEITRKSWNTILTHLMDLVELGSEDEISTDQHLVDCILSDIQQRENSTEREKVLHNSLLRLVEEKEVRIPTSQILQIMHREKINVSLRRLRELLAPFLAGNSLQLGVGKARIRFWRFNPTTLEVDITDANEEE